MSFRKRRGLVGSAIPVTLCLAMAAVLVCGTAADAALITYEGFDYTAGESLKDQSGGTGWSVGGSGKSWTGSYSVTDPADIVVGSLTYTDSGGRTLATSGHSIKLTSDGGWNSPTIKRQTDAYGSTARSTGGLWLSMLFQPNVPTGYCDLEPFGYGGWDNAGPGVRFYPNSPGDLASHGSALGFDGGHTYSAPKIPGVQSGGANLLVGHYTVSGSQPGVESYTLDWYLNPTDLSAPGANTKVIWTVTGAVNDPLEGLDGFFFRSGNVTSLDLTFDEIRYGANWADVAPIATVILVPEPATIAVWFLLGLCWTGVRVWRRRRNGLAEIDARPVRGRWPESNRVAIRQMLDRQLTK